MRLEEQGPASLIAELLTQDLLERYPGLGEDAARVAEEVVRRHMEEIRSIKAQTPEELRRTRVYRLLRKKARHIAYYRLRRFKQSLSTDICGVIEECGDQCLREAAFQALQGHASTRERLSYAEKLYSTIWSIIGRPRSIIDYGCGLNPAMAIMYSWHAPTVYYAVDKDPVIVSILRCLTPLFKARGTELRVIKADLCRHPPTPRVDAAFIFKTLHLLERLRRGCGTRLLDTARSSFVVITEAARSLTRGEDILSREKRFLRKIISSSMAAYRIIYEGTVGSEYMVVLEKTL